MLFMLERHRVLRLVRKLLFFQEHFRGVIGICNKDFLMQWLLSNALGSLITSSRWLVILTGKKLWAILSLAKHHKIGQNWCQEFTRQSYATSNTYWSRKKYFGEVAAYCHVTEFQKRGLPHEHFMLIMKHGSKLTTPEGHDKFISAEIPDKDKYPVLHALVIKHMLHGPCGILNRKCPCMMDGVCRFRYPRQFCSAT